MAKFDETERREETVLALIQALKDPSAAVRADAALGLVRQGENAVEAVPALIQALDDHSPYVRKYAAHALGVIGEKTTAVPALIQAFKDHSHAEPDEVAARYDVALALIDLAKEEALPVFIQALKDSDGGVRGSAASAICSLCFDEDVKGDEAAPALIALLKDQFTDVREAAVHALGKIGENAKPETRTEIITALDNFRGLSFFDFFNGWSSNVEAAMRMWTWRGLQTAASDAIEQIRKARHADSLKIKHAFERKSLGANGAPNAIPVRNKARA